MLAFGVYWLEIMNKDQGDPGELIKWVNTNIDPALKIRIQKLRLLRTAADHYSTNPAFVNFRGKSKPQKVYLSYKDVIDAIQIALDVYSVM